MNRGTIIALVVCSFLPLAHAAPEPREGVKVGQPSAMRKLVPAEGLERQATQEFSQLKQQAAAKKALAPDDHPQMRRLRQIAARIIPHAARFNARAQQWQWEVVLIGAQQVNAFCMPGGKIAVFSGLLLGLQLTDDEAAVVMGHEIAHALREHARERIAKTELTRLGASLLSEFVGGGKYSGVFSAGGQLMTLKFSRDDETEADTVGLELAARAGYDPRAGVTLWKKMMSANKGAPPQWLSTHPSGNNRIEEIERHLPDVMPIYERTKSQSRQDGVVQR
ncbi:MAG: M48 family metallopeptidase [Rhodocyclales bacterium]|jgi:predicted Zn-dependent protease|nr:M48 family metallopeptidase [Rhodocyclales bacterium]CAG0967021.1 Metalloprotease LoiP [Rhodocyclaceae bacterium]